MCLVYENECIYKGERDRQMAEWMIHMTLSDQAHEIYQITTNNVFTADFHQRPWKTLGLGHMRMAIDIPQWHRRGCWICIVGQPSVTAEARDQTS